MRRETARRERRGLAPPGLSHGDKPPPGQARRLALLPIHCFLLLLVLLAGCAGRDGPRATGPTGPVAVEVVTLRPATITRVVEQPGTVQADEETRILARIPGYVGKLYVDIDKEVKK